MDKPNGTRHLPIKPTYRKPCPRDQTRFRTLAPLALHVRSSFGLSFSNTGWRQWKSVNVTWPLDQHTCLVSQWACLLAQVACEESAQVPSHWGPKEMTTTWPSTTFKMDNHLHACLSFPRACRFERQVSSQSLTYASYGCSRFTRNDSARLPTGRQG